MPILRGFRGTPLLITRRSDGDHDHLIIVDANTNRKMLDLHIDVNFMSIISPNERLRLEIDGDVENVEPSLGQRAISITNCNWFRIQWEE